MLHLALTRSKFRSKSHGASLKNIDKYFLTARNPFSGERKLDTRRIIWLAVIGTGIGILAILGLGSKKSDAAHFASVPHPTQPAAIPAAPVTATSPAPSKSETQVAVAPSTTPATSRNYSAAQVVSRNGNASSSDKLPMGTVFAAVLANAVLSSDSASPVIAFVPNEVCFNSSCPLPAQTKILGNAALDSTSKRLQVRFHTAVFPDGQQVSISGMALKADGSSGIEGNYHSAGLKQQIGRSTGHFVAGLTGGLKERQYGGLGGAYEPGSLKNGLLSGLGQAAEDQAQIFAESMRNQSGYVEVPAQTVFSVYLDKEFAH